MEENALGERSLIPSHSINDELVWRLANEGEGLGGALRDLRNSVESWSKRVITSEFSRLQEFSHFY